MIKQYQARLPNASIPDLVVWNWHDRNPLSLQRQIGCRDHTVSGNPTDIFDHGKAWSKTGQHDPCTSTSQKEGINMVERWHSTNLSTNYVKNTEMIGGYWRNGSLQEVLVHRWFLHPHASSRHFACSDWMNVWTLYSTSLAGHHFWTSHPKKIFRRADLVGLAKKALGVSLARWKAPPKFILDWKWSRDIRWSSPWSPWTQELGVNVLLSITLPLGFIVKGSLARLTWPALLDGNRIIFLRCWDFTVPLGCFLKGNGNGVNLGHSSAGASECWCLMGASWNLVPTFFSSGTRERFAIENCIF